MVGMFVSHKASQCRFLQAGHECVVNHQNLNKHRRGGFASLSEELCYDNFLFLYFYFYFFFKNQNSICSLHKVEAFGHIFQNMFIYFIPSGFLCCLNPQTSETMSYIVLMFYLRYFYALISVFSYSKHFSSLINFLCNAMNYWIKIGRLIVILAAMLNDFIGRVSWN